MHDRVRLGRRGFLLLGGAGVLAACSSSSNGGSTTAPSSGQSPTATSSGAAPRSSGAPAAGTITQIVSGLNVPWGLAFLPNGDALVAERETGRIVRVPGKGGPAQEVVTLPGVDTDGTSEGGLLGIAVSPSYASDQLVYAYFTADDDNRIVRFTSDSTAAGSEVDVQPIVTGLLKGSIHNGGRIGFGPDGKLYAGVGETGERGLAQDQASRNGKILRVNPDGSIPADNPVRGSAVWSSGHRNVQGFAWDSAKRMWAVEFGQDTYDEVNLIEPGKNYGWPVVEGVGDTAGGKYVNPKVTWPTDEASPSGAAIIGSTLYIGALRGEAVLRVALDGTNATKSGPLAESEYGRIRTVAAAPDGALWFTTSNRDGRGDERSGDDHIYRVQV